MLGVENGGWGGMSSAPSQDADADVPMEDREEAEGHRDVMMESGEDTAGIQAGDMDSLIEKFKALRIDVVWGGMSSAPSQDADVPMEDREEAEGHQDADVPMEDREEAEGHQDADVPMEDREEAEGPQNADVPMEDREEAEGHQDADVPMEDREEAEGH
jgi:hypothetical protein